MPSETFGFVLSNKASVMHSLSSENINNFISIDLAYTNSLQMQRFCWENVEKHAKRIVGLF